MSAFLSNNLLEIFLALITAFSSIQAIHYRRLAHQRTTEKTVTANKKVKLFLSRQAILTQLKAMYDHAQEDDVIWAQCIRCTSFTKDVQTKILEAAGKGVQFQMAIFEHSPAKDEFLALFAPFAEPDIRLATNNEFSLQGLSDKEVVITFPESQGYTAVLIRHKPFVRMMRQWFLTRFKQMPAVKHDANSP